MINSGYSNTQLYSVWHSMLQRCNNPNYITYAYYGGNGVVVCDEWNNSVNFIEWALKNGYQDGLEIDRKDNEKGYSPDNCRWVTRQQNNFNTRGWKNSVSKYKGVTWNKQNKNWRAKIQFNGKYYHIGCFNSEEDAALAYNKRAIEFFGEYAYLNKIQP